MSPDFFSLPPSLSLYLSLSLSLYSVLSFGGNVLLKKGTTNALSLGRFHWNSVLGVYYLLREMLRGNMLVSLLFFFFGERFCWKKKSV